MIDPTKLKRNDLILTRKGDAIYFISAETLGSRLHKYCIVKRLNGGVMYWENCKNLDYHPLTELLLELSGKF